MIKFLLGVIVVLALIGGAIKFESNEESWQLIIHKQEAVHSVKNGAILIYNKIEELIAQTDNIKTSTLVIEE